MRLSNSRHILYFALRDPVMAHRIGYLNEHCYMSVAEIYKIISQIK